MGEKEFNELSLDELEDVAGGGISFAPLYSQLEKRGWKLHFLLDKHIITFEEYRALLNSQFTGVVNPNDYDLSFVDRLCAGLNCQPKDVIAYV